jgi:4-hydroxybenzoate polyprenyltransferase
MTKAPGSPDRQDAKIALSLPDAIADPFIFRLTPGAFHPYLQLARLDRPIGWWLLLLPCWWSSALASIAQDAPVRLHDLALFLIGAIAMRGAGSTYNDIVDRKIDAKVERTQGRPLPSGRVTVTEAKAFLLAQCLIGLAVLLTFNIFAIGLGVSSLLIVALYPFMKRITSWPQAVLGAAFAWGGLMGWAAAFGSLAPAPMLLYLGAVFWTIGYDTIYALQDIRDDARLGLGSTARYFGGRVRAGVAVLYALAAASIAGALLCVGAGGLALAGLIGFALHLAWQTVTLMPRDGACALRLFRANRDAGLLLFAGLALEAARLQLQLGS